MRSFLLAASCAAILSACATTPEPCTRAYFVYKSDELQRDFVRRNRGEVRRLRTLRTDLRTQPDLFTALAVVSAKRDLEQIVSDLRTRVIPDARSIASFCGIDEAFDIIMDGFLVEQGIDPQLVRTLGLLDLFEDPSLMSTLEPAL
ncbi:hypothetical protein [Parvularcula lutaonensis]|uniref:Lipoprotein n=1 Tax=Parvularcula lutaonensis TaxID=491923 RepID=A0ABV7MAC0_9PROT|nr:hypothetical protein [Parvularcula lutaonensis]GGY44731.1 hypothetical protein GCM10007148_12060 [Parvularcula lutaonensis]